MSSDLTFQLPQHLINAIKEGAVVLVLGAGASVTSKNIDSKSVLDGNRLSEFLAREAGLPYHNENLEHVLDATKDILGDAKIERILQRQFTQCSPSDELKLLVSFVWYRIYTFNYDDCLQNTPRSRRAQTFVFRNAMKDRREEHQGYAKVQVIHIHGSAHDYANGIVGSETDYVTGKQSLAAWYSQLGEDFFNRTIVFLGTKLDEHLFTKVITQHKRAYGITGTSYLIIPDDLSPIRLNALKSKSIEFLRGTLSDFVRSLNSNFPSGLSPSALSRNSTLIDTSISSGKTFNAAEIESLRSLYPIDNKSLNYARISDQSMLLRTGRDYLNGFGPNWKVVVNNLFAPLGQFAKITDEMRTEVLRRRAIIIVGESGSGKSTCAMAVCYNLASQLKGVDFCEYRENSSSFLDAVRSFKTLIGDRIGIILVDNLHVFIDDVSEALQSVDAPNICIVSSARLSDWRSKIAKQLPSSTFTMELRRFDSGDVNSIISKIDSFLPVPAFNKLDHSEKVKRLLKSKKQILIALKEETLSEKFDDIIEDEFRGIQNSAARFLFVLIALATIARVGLLESTCRQIFLATKPDDNFDDAITALSGIIGLGNTGRLQTRHEVYAKHVINRAVSIDEISIAIKGILLYLCHYTVPIIKSVSKYDGQLFKFVLNNAFVYETYKAKHAENKVFEIFVDFESRLQRDGHFWLQYGLLRRRFGEHEQAYDLLRKSVDAYSSNYAHTALAQQKLILAGIYGAHDPRSQKLIGEAVEFLLAEHYRRSSDRRVMNVDEYPLATLGYYHIDVLVRHGDQPAAKKAAKKYFGLIQEMSSIGAVDFLDELKTKLVLFISTGIWASLRYKKGNISYVS